jgi:hypothetical protein
MFLSAQKELQQNCLESLEIMKVKIHDVAKMLNDSMISPFLDEMVEANQTMNPFFPELGTDTLDIHMLNEQKTKKLG